MSINKFFHLIQANKDKPRNLPQNKTRGANTPLNVTVKDNEGTIYVYGVIISDEWMQWSDNDIVASQFVQEVRNLESEVDVLNVRIDSPGGEVFAARSMASAMNDFSGTVNVFVDGLAASSASFLAMSGDTITMSEGSMFMIHNAWCCCCGNANDFAKESSLLDKLDTTIANTYAKKSGKDVDELKAMMNDETWITAEEAVDMGFADSVSEGRKVNNSWDTSIYKNSPHVDLPNTEETDNKDNDSSDKEEPVVNENDSTDVEDNNRYAYNKRLLQIINAA